MSRFYDSSVKTASDLARKASDYAGSIKDETDKAFENGIVNSVAESVKGTVGGIAEDAYGMYTDVAEEVKDMVESGS